MVDKIEVRNKVKHEIVGIYDWIDTGDLETSIGLAHLRGYEDYEEHLANENEVIVGGGTDGFTEEDYDYLEDKLEEIADELDIQGEWTSGGPDHFEYTFYL